MGQDLLRLQHANLQNQVLPSGFPILHDVIVAMALHQRPTQTSLQPPKVWRMIRSRRCTCKRRQCQHGFFESLLCCIHIKAEKQGYCVTCSVLQNSWGRLTIITLRRGIKTVQRSTSWRPLYQQTSNEEDQLCYSKLAQSRDAKRVTEGPNPNVLTKTFSPEPSGT